MEKVQNSRNRSGCKNSTINYGLKWSIASKAHPYTGGARKCDLCLTEKLAIMKADPESLLNTCDECVAKFRHMNKFTLRFFKKKLLIKYITSYFLSDRWDNVYVTAFKEFRE